MGDQMRFYELGRLTPAELERLAGLRGTRRLYQARGRRRRDGSRLLYEFLSARRGVFVRVPRVVSVGGVGFVEYGDRRPVPVARVPRSLVWRVLDSPAAGFHWSAALAKVRGWA